MLRMRYMPCDFHPLLLILGAADELQRFSELLLRFAESGQSVELTSEGVFSEDTQVVLHELGTARNERQGLWGAEFGVRPVLEWCLTRETAKNFASEVLKTANGQSLAGSSTLECEVLNEIRVKVSFGEFEEQFLLGDIW